MKKILVIEDETPVRQGLVDLLGAEGYLVVAASDGEEGVRTAWETLPDLILCDVMMPRLDGFGVLSRLSKDPATALIPFIFLTARNDNADLRRGMGLGADDYITKPFKLEDLLAAVDLRLEKRAALERQTQRKLAEISQNLQFGIPQRLMAQISVILGFSETLANRQEGANMNPLLISNMAQEINQAANDLLRSVQNILLLTDLERVQTDPERLAHMLDSRVLSAWMAISEIAELKADQERRKTDLQLNLQDCSLSMSEIYLQKIVEELLDNAFAYSPAGFPVEVTGEKITAKKQYLLRVKDFGRGIPTNKLAWLNNLPVRDIQSMDKDEQGAGIVVVKRLAELHGGSFRLQSEVKSWTIADVLLPVSE